MFKHYFKTAWRNIIRNKTITLINLFSLSVALAVFILIAFWVHNELNFDNFHKDAKDIYLTEMAFSAKNDPISVTALPFADLLKKNSNVQYTARMVHAEKTLKIGRQLFLVKNGAFVDDDWFKIFDYKVISGNLSSFYQDPHSLIFTESKAKQLFGHTDPIGQIVMSDTTLYQIKAIVEDNPINSSFQFDMLVPMSNRLGEPGRMERDNNWNNASYRTFVKVHSATNIPEFTARTTAAARQASDIKEIKLTLQPLSKLHFSENSFIPQSHNGNRTVVFIFGALGILLLITASINYVNLSIAKANSRTKEISIRKITGGSRWQLFLQFLLESFLMCLIALVIALLITRLALPVFNRLTETKFALSLNNSLVWLILLGSLLLTTLLNGIFPALTMAFFHPLSFLKGHTILKFKSILLRKGLVVFQFVVGVVFIVGTIVIFLQMNLARTSAAQYQRSQVVSFRLPTLSWRDLDAEEIPGFCQAISNDLRRSNFIEGVALANGPIEGTMSSTGAGGWSWSGKDTSLRFPVARLSITADAIDIFNFQVKEGRWFNNSKIDRKNFVINETAVKELGLQEPVIGQVFGKIGGDTGRIVGVIRDYNFRSLYDKIQPMAIGNSDDDIRSEFFVKIAPGKITQAMNAIKATWQRFLPGAPFEYEFMNQAFDNIYKNDLRISKLILLFSCITITISVAGLFGLAAFIAEQRNREIGIRKVFGASVRNIMLLLSYDFIRLVCIAVIVAAPIAWWASSKWLNNFAYKIHLSPWIFMSAGLLILIIAFLTISVQTVRAARTNPVDSLKME